MRNREGQVYEECWKYTAAMTDYDGEKFRNALQTCLAHPVLIASHIKPYKDSAREEAFDVNNGLLLSRNTDSLFDLGYMTFREDGTIIPANVLDKNMADYLSQFRLHADFINSKRMSYMQYHRKHVFQKRYAAATSQRYHLQSNEVLGMVAEEIGRK